MRISLDTPLDKLLYKYGMSRNSLAKKMAEIELQNFKEKVVDETYLSTRFKSYRGELSKYARQEREPTASMLYYLAGAIGCDLDELFSTLKHNKKIPEKEEINEEKLIAQGYDFVCLEVHITSIYYSDNRVYGSKRFKIKSLKDDLKYIKKLDYYKFIRENDKKNIEFDCSNGVEVKPVNKQDSDENFVDVFFKEALRKGQEIELTLGFSAEKILANDSTFHYTWIRFPTQYLTMTVTPPNPVVGQGAKVLEYTDKRTDSTLPKGVRQNIGNLRLNQSLSFKWEKDSPELYHSYEINWEANSDLY
jgi:transcriptional regulator with XRE-family HTH domain